MRKKIYFSITIVLTVLVLILSVNCCSIIGGTAGGNSYDGREDETEAQILQDSKSTDGQKESNVTPIAVMEIFQQNSNDDYFTVGNTVYLSASGSMDLDGDPLSYQWQIGDGETLSGEEVYHVFKNTGEYEIVLTVNDGSDSTRISRKIFLIEPNENIIKKKAHDMIVSIEYIIKNTGPAEVHDLMCLIEVPQTYQPFQVVESRKSNYSEKDDLYTDEYNLIARFNLGSLQAGESANAYISCNTVLYEYEYADITDGVDSYSIGDKDLSLYTKGEYFINSDSKEIETAVKSITGTERNPAVIAEKLYDFVCSKLIYDEERLSEGGFGYFYATDILNKGKGVCTDYSILYAALCRAAGIPARFVQGIPVFTILAESDNRLPYGHAWVEIKLPGYGWVPIDITAESGFMSYNYYLNMETYKGSGIFYKSLDVEGNNYYPFGFYYSWSGDTEPRLTQETIYSVSGLSINDVSVMSESKFLDELKIVLAEYNAAINNLNQMGTGSQAFNDPQTVAIEEAFLGELISISNDLKNLSYSGDYAEDRNNLVDISDDINTYKEEQIKCMKEGNYDCYSIQFEMFAGSMNELFNYYNNMASEFNSKY